jgi:hypothetical protein
MCSRVMGIVDRFEIVDPEFFIGVPKIMEDP